MLIRRDALEGRLFRDDFFMYGEDVELCQRLRAAGWRMRYFAAAEVLHHGGATSKKARTDAVRGRREHGAALARDRSGCMRAGYVAIVPIAWPLGVLVQRIWKP